MLQVFRYGCFYIPLWLSLNFVGLKHQNLIFSDKLLFLWDGGHISIIFWVQNLKIESLCNPIIFSFPVVLGLNLGPCTWSANALPLNYIPSFHICIFLLKSLIFLLKIFINILYIELWWLSWDQDWVIKSFFFLSQWFVELILVRTHWVTTALKKLLESLFFVSLWMKSLLKLHAFQCNKGLF